tara:strand:- start:303 stop:641 length:339 start_codon:yes stop_codon:yes gene_type:complete
MKNPIAETLQTEYKTTRDFNTTGRKTNLRLHTVTLPTTGKTFEFLRSYNQLVAYKSDDDTYHRTDKTTASPRWSVTTARHVNSYLQGRKAEVVEQARIDDTFWLCSANPITL